MAAAPVTIYGAAQEALSSAPRIVDGADIDTRFASRGELIVENLFNGLQGLAMEGSYFLASTATPGTGIVLSVATGTSFSDTQALLCINNNGLAGLQSPSIYLDFITLICTATPTGTTAQYVAGRLDPAQTRGTAGTQLGATGTSPRSCNSAFAADAAAGIFALGASAVAVAASSNVRNGWRAVLRAASTPSWVVGDHVTLKFASQEMAAGGVNLGATTASGITVFLPPVVIGPGASFVLNEWATARSGALSGEVVVGYAVR